MTQTNPDNRMPLPDAMRSRAEEKSAACRQAANDNGIDLPDSGAFRDDASRIFAMSEFVARNCIRNPFLLRDLVESGDLERSREPGEFDSKIKALADEAGNEEDFAAGLRHIRNREMVRIAWRDLSGRADLFETLSDLSSFADTCLDGTLSFLHERLCENFGRPVSQDGTPQYLVVIGMGKLGGYELNFSSDIDLIFAFPESGATTGGSTSIANEDFFSRLGRRLIDVFAKTMVEGFVFRVDTRLRPYGDSGPLVMSFDAMENYYQMFGREWERYALIKARIVAGDMAAGNALFDRLRPFVYRRYLDYGTFESIREMKRKIEREVIRKRIKNDIKHGLGGIREIEFFVQVFQLIRGGIDPRYQERSLMKVLLVMARERCITEQVYEELTAAYYFLRNTEHRLQMFDDKQTHSLPADDVGKQRVAVGMGFSDWDSFFKVLNDHMDRVHFHFHELLSPESGESENGDADQMETVWQNQDDSDRIRQILADAGYVQIDEVNSAILKIREAAESDQIGSPTRDRIDRLMPLLLKHAAKAERPAMVLMRIIPLVESVIRRSCYISLLLENPGVLEHLVQLASISPWIISFIGSHPLLLDELLDVRTLYEPLEKEAMAEELSERLSRVPEDDVELQMNEVRVFKQVNTLRIVAADVTGHLPVMKVSDRLTWLAETVLDTALRITWHHLVERYGRPSHLSGTADGEMGFATIAYGKLGGIELGYGSDLDLVFLHTATKGETEGGRLRPIYNTEFYARLGQRIIHFLTAPTQTGRLYEADMRLRPSGNAGVLVSHIDAFEEYQRKEAWNWEHQALIKARPINGDPLVMDRFALIRKSIISMRRDSSTLKEAVAGMREKMRKTGGGSTKNEYFDLKQDRGGIIDIEFLVQYLILRHAHENESLEIWTDVVRQLNMLAMAGIIDDITAHSLKQAYLIYRYFVHRLNLQEKSAVLPESRFHELRKRVQRIWAAHLT